MGEESLQGRSEMVVDGACQCCDRERFGPANQQSSVGIETPHIAIGVPDDAVAAGVADGQLANDYRGACHDQVEPII